MSTRSMIGIVHKASKKGLFAEDRIVSSVYCHSDGYLEYTGLLLELFYSNPSEAQILATHGAISILGADLPKAVIDFTRLNTDDAYYRSLRHYTKFFPESMYPKSEFCYRGVLKDMPMESFNYLYSEDAGIWYVCAYKYTGEKWLPLKDVIFNNVHSANELSKTVKHGIDSSDVAKINKLNSYLQDFTEYRQKHPYLPSYTELNDENTFRKDRLKQASSTSPCVNLHLDKIGKVRANIMVTFTLEFVGGMKQSSTQPLGTLLQAYFENDTWVMKNPSLLQNYLRKGSN